MLVGTVVAGLATYAWHAAAARMLGEVAFAPVASVWTLMFLMITVLIAPLEQYAIRSVAAGGGDHSDLRRALPAIGRLAVGASATVVAATWALRDQLFDGDAAYVAVCAAILVGFGQLALVRGMLAGQRNFAAYGWITGLDSILRLAASIPLLLGGVSALVLAWTVPACSLVALAWLLRPMSQSSPRPLRAEASDRTAQEGFGRFIAHTVGGTIPAQVILAGGPLVVAFLGAGEAAITSLFVTQTAFRAVFLIATPSWSRALPVFTRWALGGDDAVLRRLAQFIVVATILVAVVGCAVSMFLAPTAIALLFGEGTRPKALVAGLSMAGTLAAVGNLGLNTLLVAQSRTRFISASWWVALAVSAALVTAVPGEAALRAAVGFAGAELVAVVGLGAAVRRRPDDRLHAGGRPTSTTHDPVGPGLT